MLPGGVADLNTQLSSPLSVGGPVDRVRKRDSVLNPLLSAQV